MSAYMVYLRNRITDPDEFRKYEDAAPAASAGHPATPLAFYGPVQTLEGAAVDGAVIVEFPTAATARAAYDSPLYQDALQYRLAGAEYRAFIVESLIRRHVRPAGSQNDRSGDQKHRTVSRRLSSQLVLYGVHECPDFLRI